MNLIGGWLVYPHNKYYPGSIKDHEDALVQAGLFRMTRNRSSQGDASIIFTFSDPLIVLSAREYYKATLTKKPSPTVTTTENPKNCGLDELVGYTLAQQLDDFENLGNLFEIVNDPHDAWGVLSGRLVAMDGTRIIPAGWGGGSHLSIVQRSMAPQDTALWFKERIGIPLLLTDYSMHPDILALVQLKSGEHLWLVIHVELRNDIASEAVETASSSLKSSSWWKSEVMTSGFRS